MNTINPLRPEAIPSTPLIEASNTHQEVKIPIIDMNEWFDANLRSLFVDRLKATFNKYGFVVVKNVPINDLFLAKTYQSIQSFFKQNLEIKMKTSSSTNSGERGFVRSELAKNAEIKINDFKEFINFGRELTPEQQQKLQYPENIWPEDPLLKESITSLYKDLEIVVAIFSEAIALALGEHPSLISDMTREGDHMLRANYYPPNPPQRNPRGSEHTDTNLFTLLPKATTDGLQVKLPDGTWGDVMIPEDARNAFVLNAGDCLKNLTNGYFTSALHRVVPKRADVERYSIALFVHARNEDRMDPLQSTIEKTGGVRKFPNATRLQLLDQHLVVMERATRPMMERLHNSGLIEEQQRLGLEYKKALAVLTKNGIGNESNH